MILRYVLQTVLLWLITKIFGRFIPILRRGRRLFSL